LSEPTLAVSPWFESRRIEYYDRLLHVSTSGGWDGFLRFFAEGLRQSADATRQEMNDLVAVQTKLHEEVRRSRLRADSAHSLVDLAVANPSFTARRAESELKVSYGRANALIGQLVDLGVLSALNPGARNRRFFAPLVLEVLATDRSHGHGR
jgi:Fic family protein